MLSFKLFNIFFCKYHTWEIHSIVTDRIVIYKAKKAHLVSICLATFPDLDQEPFMFQTWKPANWALVGYRLLGRYRRGHNAGGENLGDPLVYCCHNNIIQQALSWEGHAGTRNLRICHTSNYWCLAYPEHTGSSCMFSTAFPTPQLGGDLGGHRGSGHPCLPSQPAFLAPVLMCLADCAQPQLSYEHSFPAASSDLAQCSQELPPVGVLASSFLASSRVQRGLDRLAGASEGVQALG